MSRVIRAAVIVLAFVGPFAEPARSAPAAIPETEAKRLEQQIVAPCCWRQTVAVHDSAVAQEIRADIRARLTRGETPAQVLDAYLAQYGTAILIEPPAEGAALSLYVLPPVVLVLSAALLVIAVRRLTRSTVGTAQRAPAPLADAPSAESVRRLDDDLDAMD